jgi:hypothetical protein
MPVWLLFVAAGAGGLWLLRRGQKVCAELAPVGEQRGPATRLQQDRILGPAPGDLSAPNGRPIAQNPPVTTQIHSEIVSSVHKRRDKAVDAAKNGGLFTYGSRRPAIFPAIPPGAVTAGFDQLPPYRSQLPYIIDPSILTGEAPVVQSRLLAAGRLIPPATGIPNQISFADITGGVGVRKKLGTY